MPGTARNKLNAAVIHGVLLIAGLIAFLTGSWEVFALLIVVLIATAFLAGDLRLPPRNDRNRPAR